MVNSLRMSQSPLKMAAAMRLHRSSTHAALFSEFNRGISISSFWGVSLQFLFVGLCIFTQFFLFPLVLSLISLCAALALESGTLYLVVRLTSYMSMLKQRNTENFHVTMDTDETVESPEASKEVERRVTNSKGSPTSSNKDTWLKRGHTGQTKSGPLRLGGSSTFHLDFHMGWKHGLSRLPLFFFYVHDVFRDQTYKLYKKHRLLIQKMSEAQSFTRVIRTIIWCLQYIWATQYLFRETPDAWWNLSALPPVYFYGESVLLWLVNVDYCLGLLSAKSKLEFIRSPQSFLDFITMPPVIFMGIQFGNMEQLTPSYYMVRFGWVRFLRLYGIMPVLERIFHTLNHATLEIVSIVVALIAVVFAFAGAVFTQDSPCEDGAFKSFFDYVYYAVLTIKAAPPWNFDRTGAYGLPWTRVFSVISIFIAMTLVPFKIGHITRLLAEPITTVGNVNAVVNSPSGFILLAGCCTASQLEVWAEYFSSFKSPGAPKCLAYLHGGVEPVAAFEKVRLHLLHQCGIQLAVVQGDCATKAEASLGPLQCGDAAATVIFAELSASSGEEVKSDRMAVIRLLAVQKFQHDMENVSAVFNQNSAKLLALDLGVRSVLVINELRMKLLAKSSVECPGLATLVANLYHLVPTAAAKSMRKSLWRHGLRPLNYIPIFDAAGNCVQSEATAADEYVRGAAHSVYQLKLPICMVDEAFLEAVKVLLLRFGALLIGIRDRDSNLRLNPGPSFKFSDGDDLILLLSSSQQVREISELREMKLIWNCQDAPARGNGAEMEPTVSEASFANIAQKHKDEELQRSTERTSGQAKRSSKQAHTRELLLSKPYSDIITSSGNGSGNGDTCINSGSTKRASAKRDSSIFHSQHTNSSDHSEGSHEDTSDSELEDGDGTTRSTVIKQKSDLWQGLTKNGHQLGFKKPKKGKYQVTEDQRSSTDSMTIKIAAVGSARRASSEGVGKAQTLIKQGMSTQEAAALAVKQMNERGGPQSPKSPSSPNTGKRPARSPREALNQFRTSVRASTICGAIQGSSFRNMLPNITTPQGSKTGGNENGFPERRRSRAQSVVVTSAFKYYEAKEKKVKVNDFEEAQRDLWGNIVSPEDGVSNPPPADGSAVAKGFLLICGWPRNLFGFLRTALRDSWGAQKCIILAPKVPSHTPLESLAEFWPHVLYVQGSALQRFDLARAGLYQACAVVVFAEAQAEEAFSKPQAKKYSADIEAVLAVSKIRAMRDVHLVVELRDPLRNLCLLDGSSWTPSNSFTDLTYLDCPEYVAGNVWTDETLYSFASSELPPELLSEYVVPAAELSEHLVDGGEDQAAGSAPRPSSSCCRLIQVPESWVEKPYYVMFLRLLKWGIVAIGLYRALDTPSGKRRYVVTSPDAETKLRSEDQIYVLPPTSEVDQTQSNANEDAKASKEQANDKTRDSRDSRDSKSRSRPAPIETKDSGSEQDSDEDIQQIEV